MPRAADPAFDAWIKALEQRHLANLRVQEVTRALRALSSIYVERREALGRGAALDSAGKRAAFALFYGPLHYLVARHIVVALDAAARPAQIVDLGCGTGACGAAFSIAASGARVAGVDRHPWAVEEANWTYRVIGVPGAARRGDAARVPSRLARHAVVLAYTANELPDRSRNMLLQRLLAAAADGGRVLVIEPVARPVATWWDEWAGAFVRGGGREDTWRFEEALPDLLRLFDQAAGLDHRVLTARSLYVDGSL